MQDQRPDAPDIISTHLEEKQISEGESLIFPTLSKKTLPSTTTKVDNIKAEMEDDIELKNMEEWPISRIKETLPFPNHYESQ